MPIRFPLMAGGALLLSACALIATPRTVAAGPIVFTGVVMNDGSCTPYVDCVVDPINSPNDADPGDIGKGGDGLVENFGIFNGATLSGAADATAGVLHTRASASYDLGDTPGYRIASAAAIVADWLTITDAGTANGAAGVLDVSLTLDGTITRSGTADAGTLFAVLWGGTAPFDGQEFKGFSTETSSNGTYTVSVPFTVGDPLLVTLFMWTGAGTIGVCSDLTGCPDTEGTRPFLATGTGAASADFFNTLVLSGLLPKVGGVALANPVFTADSGARYTVNGVVPEPGTLALLGSGMAFLFARRRKRSA